VDRRPQAVADFQSLKFDPGAVVLPGQPESALGQKQTSDCRRLMSAIHPKADIARRHLDVRFVPIADIASPARAAHGAPKQV
jgi:hypothetical protein